MILYSVTVTIDAAAEAEWLEWMRNVHVADVVGTGYFSSGEIYQVIDRPNESERTYVIQYRCASIEDYRHYRDHFAPALQKQHTDRFAGRFRASRQLLRPIGNED